MKIKISTIMTFLLFHIIFINIRYLSFYNIITYSFIFMAFICLVFTINKDILKKKKKINVIMLTFCLFIVISSLINKNHIYRGLIYAMKIIEVFLFFEYVHHKNIMNDVIKKFYYLTLIYCVINDFIMLLRPDLYNQYSAYYLLGNKFTISYLHIYIIIFSLFFRRKKKIQTLALFLWAIVISIYTECSTAVIGCVILLFIYFINKHITVLFKPKVIIITLFISCSILLFFSGILQNKIISNFIVNVLHEDIGLTGRVGIYDKIFEIILPKILFGYGYGNSYEIVMDSIHAPNTQNGLTECLLDYGLFGTIFLVYLIYTVFKNLNNNKKFFYAYTPIVFCVYVYAILAMVEVTLDINFLTFLAMLNIGNYRYTLEKGEYKNNGKS